MSFLRYLADRWVSVIVLAAALAFVAVVLVAYGLDVGTIRFVLFVEVFAAFCAAIHDFLRRRRFYDGFAAVCADIDRKYLVSEVVERPAFLEGQLAYDALREASKGMNDTIATSRRTSEEYRDYIETWVHEVKTPIAVSQLIVERDRTPSTVSIGRELDRIEGCVEQALYYARGTTLVNDYLIRQVDLAGLVRGVVRERSRLLIATGIRPVFGPLDQTVPADAKWCSFIIGQLVDNAVKYRAAGRGVLRFSAERLDEGTAGERVVLTVADDGIGIPAADLSRVCDRAFTGENGRGCGPSTGMGLYLCRRLCDKMGLVLAVDSEEGVGTRVTVSFPENRMYLP